jgi:hypothetical protein
MASSLEAVKVSRTRLRDRDIEALAFIGRGYEVAQYQLHEAIFASRSPNVVSRFVTRASERGFIAAERLGGIGMNRLRLTRRGREFLIDRGIAEGELFAPAKAVALKDVAHTLAINDLRVALSVGRAPDSLFPAWLLQRKLPAEVVIPDLLARWHFRFGRPGLLLACEVDLGCERLNAVFIPKLNRLGQLLEDVADEESTAIAIFTRGAQRLEHLCDYASDAKMHIVPVALPHTTGSRDGICAFRTLFGDDTNIIEPKTS